MVPSLLFQQFWQRMRNWRLEPERVHDEDASHVGTLLTDKELEQLLNGFHVTLHGPAPFPHEEGEARLTLLQRSRNYEALYKVDLVIEEGNRLLVNGTLSEEMAASTELALRIGLALGHLKHLPSVSRRVEMRRQIKATLRTPRRVATDQLTRHRDRLIEVALFHLEKRTHPVSKQREGDEVVDW
jgi:hypothetical protein